MQADRSQAHAIISDRKGLGVNDPTWSPDGTKILYWGDYNSQLFVFSLRTGRTRLLPLDEADVLPAAWGTPGIAYIAGESEARVMLYDPKTDHSKLFASVPYQIVGLAWSRDGRLAVLTEKQEGQDWVYVYSPDGRELERLRVRGPSWAGTCVDGIVSLSWLPDGGRLLVVGDTQSRLGVWTSGLSDRRWTKLPIGPVGNCSASWR
jgi:Tol biopolymer transport system component